MKLETCGLLASDEKFNVVSMMLILVGGCLLVLIYWENLSFLSVE